MSPPVLFAFHAERLHDDRVWHHTIETAEQMARRDQRATFFVYPFRSLAAGHDVATRVRRLNSLGHEIAQHTHFYAGTQTEWPDKRDDLSPANVAACIERDHDYLATACGAPRGFTSGAFKVPPQMVETLARLGFAYDCSACYPKPRAAPAPDGETLTAAQRGALLRVPTYASVGEWFKWGRRRSPRLGTLRPIVYVHDYDLVDARTRLLWRLLTTRHPPTADLATTLGVAAR